MKLCNSNELLKQKSSPALAAIGWIDQNNIGNISPELENIAIAEGARLQWTFPWNTDSEYFPFPLSIQILRGKFDKIREFPRIDCGMLPTCFVHKKLWIDLDLKSMTGALQIWEPQNKEAISAVYFENPTTEDWEVNIELSSGKKYAHGIVKAGQNFYCEGPDIARLHILGRVTGLKPQGMHLNAGVLKEMHPEIIAEIDARDVVEKKLHDVKPRLTFLNSKLPFTTISEEQWDEFRGDWNLAMEMDVNAWARVQIALSHSWELAVLAGFGFIDGSEIDVPSFDEVIFSGNDRRLRKGIDFSGHYFYLAKSTFQKKDKTEDLIWTSPAVTTGRASKLFGAEFNCEKALIVSAKSTHSLEVKHTVVGKDEMIEKEVIESYICNGNIRATFSGGHQEDIVVTTDITKSQIHLSATDIDPRTFNFGLLDVKAGQSCFTWRNLSIYRYFDLETRVPFIDSKVGLQVIVKDGWSRHVLTNGLARQTLELTYDSIGQQIVQAKCNTDLAQAQLWLVNNPEEPYTPPPASLWKPRELDILLKSTMVILERRGFDKPYAFDVTLGYPVPSDDGFESDIDFKGANVDATAKECLIGGRLIVGEIQATITGFKQTNEMTQKITFEVVNLCGSVSLFSQDAHGKIEETYASERLWKEMESIQIQDLSKANYKLNPVTLLLGNNIWESQIFHFTTRLTTKFNEREYKGPISTPDISAQYLAPRPPKPIGQFSIQNLGFDYFGRQAIRILGAESSILDSKFQHRIFFTNIGVEENIVNIENPTEENVKSIQKASIVGEINYQHPFEHSTLFDVFNPGLLMESCVIGISTKNDDDIESEFLLQKSRRII